MKNRYTLPGGGGYSVESGLGSIHVHLDMEEDIAKEILELIEGAVHTVIEEMVDVEIFRPRIPPKKEAFLIPRCDENGALFCDGSRIVIRDGEPFPVAPDRFTTDYEPGKREETYKAFMFSSRVGDKDRILAAIRRWAQ